MLLATSVNHEIIRSQNGSYQNGICPQMLGGGFIQGWSENVDLNTELIDGKNTFHSMARVVFQVDDKPTSLTQMATVKMKRGQCTE